MNTTPVNSSRIPDHSGSYIKKGVEKIAEKIKIFIIDFLKIPAQIINSIILVVEACVHHTMSGFTQTTQHILNLVQNLFGKENKIILSFCGMIQFLTDMLTALFSLILKLTSCIHKTIQKLFKLDESTPYDPEC